MAVENLVDSLRAVVVAERNAEIAEEALIQESHSLRNLVRRGVALRQLRVGDSKSTTFDRVMLTLHSTSSGVSLPATQIQCGDLVQVRVGVDTILCKDAVVVRMRREELVLSLNCSWPPQDTKVPRAVAIVRVGNEVTYRRCLHAVTRLQTLLTGNNNDAGVCVRLANVLTGVHKASSLPSTLPIIEQRNLNTQQFHATRAALASNDVFLVHGPPGCGKTTVIVRIIEEAVRSGKRVLACAPSNIAVDNLVQRLAEDTDVKRMIRLGHSARMMSSVSQYSVDELMQHSEAALLANDIRKDITAILTAGRSNESRHNTRLELKALRNDLKKMEKRSMDELMNDSQVVLSTCVGAGISSMKHRQFDLAVIDEAAQALESACWIPILSATRVVLAGDHHQLAPTVKSKEGAQHFTMFARLHALLKHDKAEQLIVMLSMQYRMHHHIMAWSSREFYRSFLVAHESVNAHLLCELSNIRRTGDTTAPLILIDTSGCECDEEADEYEHEDDGRCNSIGNTGEAHLVALHVSRLLAAGLQHHQIAVLTPYNRQVDICQRMLADLDSSLHANLIEVGTVDGFQGREKEAIVLSMVRSNNSGTVGFLVDERRTNVAVTRARRHLVLIGDVNTLSRHDFLRRLVEYCSRSGQHRPARLYMDQPDLYDSADEAVNEHNIVIDDIVNISAKITTHKKVRLSKAQRREQKKNQKNNNHIDAERSHTLHSSSFDDECVRKQLLALQCGEKIHFPHDFVSSERKIIHAMCEELHLHHQTYGSGLRRHIVVTRDDMLIHVSPATTESARLTNGDDDGDDGGDDDSGDDDEDDSGDDDDDGGDDVDEDDGGGDDDGGDDEDVLDDHNSVPNAATVRPVDSVMTKPKAMRRRRRKKKTVKSASMVNDEDIEDESVEAALASLGIQEGRCRYDTCKRSVRVVGIVCGHCNVRYCVSHANADTHGCTSSAINDARQRFKQDVLRSQTGQPPLTHSLRTKVNQNLNSKLAAMRFNRTSKISQHAADKHSMAGLDAAERRRRHRRHH